MYYYRRVVNHREVEMRYTINMYNQNELLFQKSSDDLGKLTLILFDCLESSMVDIRAYIYDSIGRKIVRHCSKKIARADIQK